MDLNLLSFEIKLIFFLIINSILIGSLVRAHYVGSKKFRILQVLAIFLARIPSNIFFYIKKIPLNGYFNKSDILLKHKHKKKFTWFITKKRSILLVLPRYDHFEKRSLVEIIDLNNFHTIHTYRHNIDEMNLLVKNKKYFPGLNTLGNSKKFLYWDPLILEDGSLICNGNPGPEFKMDLNSNLKWINDKLIFHHSKMLDHEKNYWVCGRLTNRSKILKNNSLNEVDDDAIVKMNVNGEILYQKSLIEILFENKLWDKNKILELKKIYHPIHLNCIEPVFENTKFWKKGDVFINLKHQSQIILFRPSTNQVLESIKGPFSMQHDIKIISKNKISIFNNNNFLFENKFSEIVIYDFETKKFKKIFNKELKKEKFKTYLSGKSKILKDGSLFVEEARHGRIILFNNKGKKEWEYINKSKNGLIGYTSGCRIIEDENFIKKFNLLLKPIKS